MGMIGNMFKSVKNMGGSLGKKPRKQKTAKTRKLRTADVRAPKPRKLFK